MNRVDLNTPIEYLKGVGPKRGEALRKELQITNLKELLDYFPFRYVDRTQFATIRSLHDGLDSVQLRGKIRSMSEAGKGRGKRLKALFEDDSGTIDLVWFKGVSWIKSSIQIGQEYVAFGKLSRFKGRFTMAHPELEPFQNQTNHNKLQPVYHSTEKLTNSGLNSKGIEKIISASIQGVKGNFPEIFPGDLLQNVRLMNKEAAYFHIHCATDDNLSKQAIFRLKFEELFFLQLLLIRHKMISSTKMKGHLFFKVGDQFNTFFSEHLPFELTGAQKRVLKEIRRDMGSGAHMNRLLQGDVGSGKTLVALLTMLLGLDNGFQAGIMAPTEILATQHFETIQNFVKDMPIKVGLLTGSTKKKDRTVIHEALKDGSMHILIGTHALLEDVVEFQNLGVVVIDEQHRFGVAQRARLWKKNTVPPHVLVMTATPIPRTLAMTFYGDLDVSVIDELPPGRKPIRTSHKFDKSRLEVFGFMDQQIQKGHQVYVVYPLIEESETLDYKDLTDGYESIVRRFPNYQVSIVHGQMKSEDKDFEMKRFAEGKTQIMVATTVIEVGVNVPNASVMVIESAEKFGLAQLHQLRGRVGRGADQSYCILMSGYKLSQDGRKRLETMVETNDGFQIAEVDLKLRGPGDILGTQQSGILDLKVADLARDGQILQLARNTAMDILKQDPNLRKPQHEGIKRELLELSRNRPNWSRIG